MEHTQSSPLWRRTATAAACAAVLGVGAAVALRSRDEELKAFRAIQSIQVGVGLAETRVEAVAHHRHLTKGFLCGSDPTRLP